MTFLLEPRRDDSPAVSHGRARRTVSGVSGHAHAQSTGEGRVCSATPSPARALWRRLFDGGIGYLCAFSGMRQGKALVDVRQRFYAWPHDESRAERWIQHEAQARRETYFCAHLLTGRERRKDRAGRLRACYVDADGASIPNGFPRPTIIVESSPGRHQFWWVLSKALTPADAEALNRALAYALGADRTGWDLTQLLRPPGLPNFKYPDAPIVTVIDDAGPVYDPDQLADGVPQPLTPPDAPGTGSGVDRVDEPPIRGMDAALWRGERPTYADGEIDRSATLWHIAVNAEEHGATPPLLARIFEDRDRALGYNKYADRPEMYRQQAEKVVTRERKPVATATLDASAPETDESGSAKVAHWKGRALRAEATVENLSAILRARLALRRNKHLKTVAATAEALAYEIDSATSRGVANEDGSITVSRAVLAENSGCSVQAISDRLDRLSEWGLLKKHVPTSWHPEIDPETGEVRGEVPRREIRITLPVPPAEWLKLVAEYEPGAESTKQWGGTRARTPCPEHPDAGVVSERHCAACDRLLEPADSLWSQDDTIGTKPTLGPT